MSSQLAPRWIEPEEYLEAERAAETKSEYFNGRIFAMAGASRLHTVVCVNLTREVSSQLKGRPCETYVQDLRVRVENTGLYTYPDIAVVCGKPQLADGHNDVLLNPTLIIEVLSPTTEAYDRGDKFAHYRRLDSLREYVLVAQDRARIERYVRRDEAWILTEFSSLDEIVFLESIDCSLTLREVYDKVEFQPRPDLDRQKPM